MAQYDTLFIRFPENGSLQARFALDTRDGKGIAVYNGGIWKNDLHIGNFDGLIGFGHNVSGEDKDAVDTLMRQLSDYLTENYGVSRPGNSQEDDEITL